MGNISDEAKATSVRIAAARKGCAQCSGPVRVPPAGDPFSSGPFVGRYLCSDCWTLYWDQHPKDLADDESRQYVAEEARRIRFEREGEVLFEEGQNRVYLMGRGTLVFDIKPSEVKLEPNEFDPARFQAFMQAVKAITGKVPGFDIPELAKPVVTSA